MKNIRCEVDKMEYEIVPDGYGIIICNGTHHNRCIWRDMDSEKRFGIIHGNWFLLERWDTDPFGYPEYLLKR